MKKCLSLLAVLLVLCIFGGSIAVAEEDPLLAISMEMVANVHALASDAGYMGMYGFMSDQEYIPTFAEADCADLRQAYSLKIPGVNLLMLLAGGTKMSEAGRIKAKRTLYSSLSSYWNGSKGSSAMTDATLLTWSHSYAAPEGFGDCAWLVDCSGAIYHIAFVETGENIITATASPIFLDEGETIDTVLESFREQNPTLSLSQIYPPQP
ncbi:MAG: hypothetical protein ACOYI8_11025 [Christensenellales bacterium]|jgi:hypothetical protein